MIKSVRKAAGDCLKNPEDYAARANMMWASSLAHNGLTQCGREFQLVDIEDPAVTRSGLVGEDAHECRLSALFLDAVHHIGDILAAYFGLFPF